MSERQPSPLDRFLRLFTDVRAGEGATAMMLMVNGFLLLASYYVLKVVREPLILERGGAELKAYAGALQAVLLLGLVPAYGLLANRFPRRRLVNTATVFFLACLIAFYVMARLRLSIGIAFYVWIGIFNMMVVAQFWAFANDIYTTEEGKRLFPIVAFGASLGAVVGSWLARALAAPVGTYQLLLVGAVILAFAITLTNLIDARERRRTEPRVPDALSSGTIPAATGQYRAATGEFKDAGDSYRAESGQFRVVRPGAAPQPEQHAAGTFALVLRSRYLLAIALFVLFSNLVNTIGEYILSSHFKLAAAEAVASGAAGGLSARDIVTQYSAAFQGTTSLVAMAAQLFLVSRILKYLGVRVALLVLPAVALGGYALLSLVPVMAATRWVKIAENGTDYSVNKTASNVLFLPTTREEKYKGKQVIDAFVVRFGDLLSAGAIFVGVNLLAFKLQHFAMLNVALVAVCLVLAVLLGRRYERLAAATAT